MSMEWTVDYLRSTGNAADATYATEIAALLAQRGEDVPLPVNSTEEPVNLDTDHKIMVLASDSNSPLEADYVPSKMEEAENREWLRSAIHTATTPYAHIFTDTQKAHQFKRGVARWVEELTDVADQDLTIDYTQVLRNHGSTTAIKLSSPTDHKLALFDGQHAHLKRGTVLDAPKTSAPWIELDLDKDDEISALRLKWVDERIPTAALNLAQLAMPAPLLEKFTINVGFPGSGSSQIAFGLGEEPDLRLFHSEGRLLTRSLQNETQSYRLSRRADEFKQIPQADNSLPLAKWRVSIQEYVELLTETLRTIPVRHI